MEAALRGLCEAELWESAESMGRLWLAEHPEDHGCRVQMARALLALHRGVEAEEEARVAADGGLEEALRVGLAVSCSLERWEGALGWGQHVLFSGTF